MISASLFLSVILASGGHTLMHQNAVNNLARMPGVIAVVDTESRDRWGIDGYHSSNLNDGGDSDSAGTGVGIR